MNLEGRPKDKGQEQRAGWDIMEQSGTFAQRSEKWVNLDDVIISVGSFFMSTLRQVFVNLW